MKTYIFLLCTYLCCISCKEKHAPTLQGNWIVTKINNQIFNQVYNQGIAGFYQWHADGLSFTCNATILPIHYDINENYYYIRACNNNDAQFNLLCETDYQVENNMIESALYTEFKIISLEHNKLILEEIYGPTTSYTIELKRAEGYLQTRILPDWQE